jgi:hypothetical protein
VRAFQTMKCSVQWAFHFSKHLVGWTANPCSFHSPTAMTTGTIKRMRNNYGLWKISLLWRCFKWCHVAPWKFRLRFEASGLPPLNKSASDTECYLMMSTTHNLADLNLNHVIGQKKSESAWNGYWFKMNPKTEFGKPKCRCRFCIQVCICETAFYCKS